eukprot:9474867-Pyramimonas_sp.AAC.1
MPSYARKLRAPEAPRHGPVTAPRGAPEPRARSPPGRLPERSGASKTAARTLAGSLLHPGILT